MQAIADAGTDIIELGVPFSDPIADGAVNQAAYQRALQAGMSVAGVLEIASAFYQTHDTPTVLMTYYNPVFKYGDERFVADALSAGVDGVIIPDLPPDEAEGLMRLTRRKPFDTIFLLAPTSTDERIRKVCRASRGFIYYVSITGITGTKLTLDPAIGSHMSQIRGITDTPIAVGFGIATPEEASMVSRYGDGIIVGSAIVKRIHDPDAVLKQYLRSLRAGIA
jgi:tryptophan synthase alpha chain